MQELQRDQYQKTKADLIDLSIVLLIFSGPLLNCILYLTKRTATSGQLAIVYVAVAAISLLIAIICIHSNISKSLFKISLLLFIILIGFLLTKMMWNRINPGFESELKLYFATIPSVILIAYATEYKQKDSINITLILILDIIITLVCGLVVINGNGTTSAGLLSDSSGLLYQNTSYYASYAIGMNVFLVLETKLKKRNRFIKLILIIATAVQLLICLAAGGRGGAVLAIALILVGIIKSKGIRTALFWICIAGLAIAVLLQLAPQFLAALGIDATGITRILDFSLFSSDTNRSTLWKRSLSYFAQKPLIGNGIGSVFYLLGGYSHNAFIDILCETGIIGLCCFLFVIGRFIGKMKVAYNAGSLYRFMLISFICGFTMNMFSGYIWVNQQVLLPLVLVLCFPKNTEYVCGGTTRG